MPLPALSGPLTTLIDSKDFEFHSTLDVDLGDGTQIHICTTNLEDISTIDYGVIDYFDDLREVDQQNESLTLSVNRIGFRAQNVDGVLGGKFIGSSTSLNGANSILSYVFIDDLGNQYQVEVMHGELANASSLGPDITFQMVAHLSTDGPVGGWRTLQNACTHRYKKDGCMSLSLLPTCDKSLDGPNGCDKHLSAARITTPVKINNTPSFGGFAFQKEIAPGAPGSTDGGGAVDDGDDFNSYWRERQSVGTYTGRYEIPAYLS